MPNFDFDHYFLREQVIHVDAAVVGVSRARWCCAGSASTNNEALEVMRAARYDVLPIDDRNSKPVTEYFGTEGWNDFSTVRRRPITHRDVIAIDTNIGDVIRRFAFEPDSEGKPRRFFFLSHETRISGLITIANINCRAARAYFFELFNELETFIGNCITSEVPEDKIRSAEELAAGIKRYDKDQDNAVETSLFEHVYLLQLIRAFLRFGLGDRLLGVDTAARLEELKVRVRDLRNRACHPVKTILTNADGIEALGEELDLVEEIIFKLRPLSYPESAPPACAAKA
jgi:hypothetical protein